MRHDVITYSVEPLIPIETFEYLNELIIPDLSINFWDFLNLGFKDKLNAIAFKLLSKSNLISTRHIKSSPQISFKTFDTGNIYNTIQRHLIEYLNVYGVEPTVIIMGEDIHHQLLLGPELRYNLNVEYGKNGSQKFFYGVEVRLVRNMKGFVILSGELK